jgi:hypothetical protein
MLRGASNRSAELSIVGHRLQLGHRHPHELVAQRHGDERVDLDLDRVHECTLAGGNKKKKSGGTHSRADGVGISAGRTVSRRSLCEPSKKLAVGTSAIHPFLPTHTRFSMAAIDVQRYAFDETLTLSVVTLPDRRQAAAPTESFLFLNQVRAHMLVPSIMCSCRPTHVVSLRPRPRRWSGRSLAALLARSTRSCAAQASRRAF